MASIYLAYLLKGHKVPVTGALERFRDFVYIDDVIDAWIYVLDRPATALPVYNIGSGRPTTARDLPRNLVEACGLPPGHPIRQLPAPAGDQFGLYANARGRRSNWAGWRGCRSTIVSE